MVLSKDVMQKEVFTVILFLSCVKDLIPGPDHVFKVFLKDVRVQQLATRRC